MKKIVYILSLLILVLVSLSCSKKLPPALSKIEKDRKYIDKLEKKTPKGKLPYDENYLTLHKGDTVKNYIDLINSWDFKKEIESPMDSNILKTFIYLNEYRKSLGLSELKYSKKLELAAKIQSYYLSDVMTFGNRYILTHDNNTSYRLHDCIERVGWVKDVIGDNISQHVAENITANADIDKMSKNFNCVIESFKGSKKHHVTMLTDYFEEVGIYIQNNKNVIIVFACDIKYYFNDTPRIITYPITHPIIIESYNKRVIADEKYKKHNEEMINLIKKQTSKYNKEFVVKK
jgi:uncharacterized protein YkwD